MVKDINEKKHDDVSDIKSLLISKIQNQHKKPGQFRNKDLISLFQLCQEKLKQFNQLKQQRQKLQQKLKQIQKDYPLYRQKDRQKDQEVYEKYDKMQLLKKKQYKYRDCGKVMLSQNAYQKHMKKKHLL